MTFIMVKSCPRSEILRKGYVRKAYTKANGTVVKSKRVAATCVPDKGKPGKTPNSKKVLPKPKKGGLGKYGYSNIKTAGAVKRRAALKKAVQDEGYAPVVRRLNLISNYNKNSDPFAHRLIRSDMAWMKKDLAPIYSKSMSNKPSKKIYKKASKKASKGKAAKPKSKTVLIKMSPKLIDGKSRAIFKDSKTKRKFYRIKRSDGTYRRKYI